MLVIFWHFQFSLYMNVPDAFCEWCTIHISEIICKKLLAKIRFVIFNRFAKKQQLKKFTLCSYLMMFSSASNFDPLDIQQAVLLQRIKFGTF